MDKSVSDFTFPFDTCEAPNKNGIAQPYSTFVNVFICLMIFYFLVNSNTFFAKLFVFSILIFELLHTFSHTIHLNGPTQHYIVHFSIIFITVSFIALLYNHTKILPSLYYSIAIFTIVIIDIYVLLNNLGFIYNILTYFLIFMLILLFYYPFVNSSIKRNFLYISALVILLYGLEINEMMNCKYLIERFHFPYHIFLEITGSIAVYILCSTFYKL
jgi:hypothetical protein